MTVTRRISDFCRNPKRGRNPKSRLALLVAVRFPIRIHAAARFARDPESRLAGWTLQVRLSPSNTCRLPPSATYRWWPARQRAEALSNIRMTDTS